MNLARLMRHLLTPPWQVRRAFPTHSLRAIEAAIAASERTHSGQVCFVVEAALELAPLWRGQSARARAIDVFAQERAWDTAQNNGVLIYLLLADRDVEIVADRGIHAHVGAPAWERICADMESAFRKGQFETGVLAGIRAVGAEIARHYPGTGRHGNELADAPRVL